MAGTNLFLDSDDSEKLALVLEEVKSSRPDAIELLEAGDTVNMILNVIYAARDNHWNMNHRLFSDEKLDEAAVCSHVEFRFNVNEGDMSVIGEDEPAVDCDNDAFMLIMSGAQLRHAVECIRDGIRMLNENSRLSEVSYRMPCRVEPTTDSDEGFRVSESSVPDLVVGNVNGRIEVSVEIPAWNSTSTAIWYGFVPAAVKRALEDFK